MNFPLGLTHHLQTYDISPEKFCAILLPNPCVHLFFPPPLSGRSYDFLFILCIVKFRNECSVGLFNLMHWILKGVVQDLSLSIQENFLLYYLSKFLLPISFLSLFWLLIVQYQISNLSFACSSFCLSVLWSLLLPLLSVSSCWFVWISP